MDNFSKDYSHYLSLVDLQKELQPLCTSIQEMLARMDELESLLTTTINGTDILLDQNAETQLILKNKFNMFCNQIDSFENVVKIVQENINELQRSVDTAETELGITDSTLKGLLSKSLFGRNRQTPSSLNTNLENGNFKKPDIFKTSDYFNSSE